MEPILKFTEEDVAHILEVCDNPPEPNEAFKQAWEEYQQKKENGDVRS